MTRGLQQARFEVHTVVGREDMSILLLFVCYKGGCIVGSSYNNIRTASEDRIDIIELFLNYLTISQGNSR